MAKYAAATTVSIERSRAEIETILNRYGATAFGYANDSDRGLATIQFTAQKRHVRFMLHLPKKNEKQFMLSPKGRSRLSPEKQTEAWQQACRQRWRALTLAIKAKLEAVECNITTFEEEFMAHIVLPGGGTVSSLMRPQIESAYVTGKTPFGIAGFLTGPDDTDAIEGQVC